MVVAASNRTEAMIRRIVDRAPLPPSDMFMLANIPSIYDRTGWAPT
jgi:hypothetical protein